MDRITAFLTLVIIQTCLAYLSKELLNTDDIMVNSLSEQLSIEQVSDIIAFREKWQWVGFAILPLLHY